MEANLGHGENHKPKVLHPIGTLPVGRFIKIMVESGFHETTGTSKNTVLTNGNKTLYLPVRHRSGTRQEICGARLRYLLRRAGIRPDELVK
jgi:hypothetical protein